MLLTTSLVILITNFYNFLFRMKKVVKRHRGKKFYGKRPQYKKKIKKDEKTEGNKKKMYKAIARNKEAEDYMKRVKLNELKRQKNLEKMEESESEEEKPNETTVNSFELLLKSLSSSKNKSKPVQLESAIDSSSSEEEEEEQEPDTEGESDQDEEMNELKADSEYADSDKESSIANSELDGDEVLDIDLSDLESDKDDAVSEAENLKSGSESEGKLEEASESEGETKKETAKPDEEDEASDHLEELESDTEVIPDDSDDRNSRDPFAIHLDRDISPSLQDALCGTEKKVEKTVIHWDELGQLQFEIPRGAVADKRKPKGLIDLEEPEQFAEEGTIPTVATNSTNLFVKNQIKNNLIQFTEKPEAPLSPFQLELFSILNNYQDLYFSQRNFDNCEEIRLVYCMHALNHVLKTRSRVLKHNAQLNRNKDDVVLPDHVRDQGLARPKVLIVTPFRDSAFKVINYLISLFCNNEQKRIMKYKRFVLEFTGEELYFPKRNPKPEDYEKTFTGNVDDNFRIGICITKKTVKLYTDYYISDIIVASPLGLRMTIGAPGEKDRDFDFLSSIEMLVLDQAELFYAQNWEHVIHMYDHLHLKPTAMRDTDFSRVRNWVLNGLSKNYCQTLLFTTHELPEFRSLYNNKMVNYRGKVRTIQTIEVGSIQKVIVNVPQVFQRIDVTSLEHSFEARFEYFTKTVLPQYKNPTMAHCLIYVPSYFDYVRVRNYFKKEEISFVQVSEYSKEEKVARARDIFFHSGAHFLLYSERAHFFKRARLKGIRHLIMYAPPAWPNFYSEMINLMHESLQNPRDGFENSASMTLLYTKYDLIQLSAIVGNEKAAKLATSSKRIQMFTVND